MYKPIPIFCIVCEVINVAWQEEFRGPRVGTEE
jgi:hypothetical protein